MGQPFCFCRNIPGASPEGIPQSLEKLQENFLHDLQESPLEKIPEKFLAKLQGNPWSSSSGNLKKKLQREFLQEFQ